jgi:hypothetical protein
MPVRAGVALGLFAALTVSPATAKCERTSYQANPATASRSEVQMSASSGMDCVIRLALPKRYKLTGRQIAEKPTNGIVSIEGQTAFVPIRSRLHRTRPICRRDQRQGL